MIAVTHPVFCGPAVERLSNAPIDKILVTDTIPMRGKLPRRLEVVSVAPLIARALQNIHENSSVSSLFEDLDG